MSRANKPTQPNPCAVGSTRYARGLAFKVACGAFLLAPLAAAEGKDVKGARECVALSNEGATKRAQHQLLGAHAAFLACADQPGCPSVVAEECREGVSELLLTIPSVLLSVVDQDSRYLADAVVSVDGKVVKVDGAPLQLDPGPHEVVATQGDLRTSTQILAVESEQHKPVTLTLVHPTPPQPVQPPAPAPVATAAPRSSLAPVYVLGGVGAVGLASFSYFALRGHKQASDLEQCKPHCSLSAIDRIATNYHLADASLGVSVIALAGAGYLLWTRSDAEPQVATAGLALDIAPTPGGAFASVLLRE